MAGSPAVTDELKYLYASNVNFSNFVSVKLSDSHNYPLWKAQMLCLMESHQMRGIVDNSFDDKRAPCSKQYDSLLKGWIFGSLTPDVLRAVVHHRSASDVWWRLESIYGGEKRSEQDIVVSTSMERITELEEGHGTYRHDLSNIREKKRAVALKKKLLRATVEGRWWEAESILENDQQAATEAINDDGNTMLHVAVARGKNDFIKHLLEFIDEGREIEKRNSDGRTALHIAAIVGNTRAAELLVSKRKELVQIADRNAVIPLASAYYNMKHDTFVYLLEATRTMLPTAQHSRFFPDSGFNSGDSLVVTLIFRKQYDLALDQLYNKRAELDWNDEQVLMALAKNFPSELRSGEALIYPSLSNIHRKLVKRYSLLYHSYGFLYAIAKDILWAKRESKITYYRRLYPEIVITIFVPIAMLYPIYQLVCIFILVFFYPFLVLHFLLWKVLATVVMPIKRIDKKKKDHMKAKRFLQWVCDHIDNGEWDLVGSNHPSYTRPILEAACQGSYEVVKEILLRSPAKSISRECMNGHNIIQLTVINRSEKVYNVICPFIDRMDLSTKDSSKNNLLHLAGRLAPSFVLSCTTGAALQLQRELQWFEEVKKFMSPREIAEKNIDDETPEMVFTREHNALMSDGEKWLKTTAESCSITAALITTIVFAAAITVPGGSNQDTGIPLFKKEIAFIVFAVSDAISLFASSTALLVFLSILTARFSKRDFLISLPRRLIIGLCTLILSTIAMMIAFCAVMFLVFCEQRTWMLGPIGVLACFPVAVIVTLQFPLVIDLFKSTYRPIFLAECSRSNMKHLSYSLNREDSMHCDCLMDFYFPYCGNGDK